MPKNQRNIVAINIMGTKTKKIYINNEPLAYGESLNEIRVHDLSQDGNAVITFDVEILDLNIPTRNYMMYDDFKEAISSERWITMMKNGAAYGEIDHPLDPSDLTRWAQIDMYKASHVWRKMWITEDNKLWGRVQTFTGNGNLMWHAIKCGELPSFSIRVLGECVMENNQKRLKDTILISVDWVRFPGSRNSFVPDSSVFEVIKAPIIGGFSPNNRVELKAESANLLGIDRSRYELVSVGEGAYVTVEKLKQDEKSKFWNTRLNSF